ncbi:MAG: type I restriction enzyme HsdR N-terminal domain-containing protein [Rikenellaceae bacterium]
MLKSYPKLNFPPIKLKVQQLPTSKTPYAWSQLRGSYVALTPEEWVRRHLVEYLIAECGAVSLQMVEEYPVNLNGQPQRADIVVIDNQGNPLILAECKAPNIKLSNDTLAQAVRYNSVLKARYIILTNGLKHMCLESVEGKYIPLNSFPKL